MTASRATRETLAISHHIKAMRRWVRRAAARDRFCYHEGSLWRDRVDDPVADAMGFESARLAGAGLVTLAQSKWVVTNDLTCVNVLPPPAYRYYMIRTRRPFPLGGQKDAT